MFDFMLMREITAYFWPNKGAKLTCEWLNVGKVYTHMMIITDHSFLRTQLYQWRSHAFVKTHKRFYSTNKYKIPRLYNRCMVLYTRLVHHTGCVLCNVTFGRGVSCCTSTGSDAGFCLLLKDKTFCLSTESQAGVEKDFFKPIFE